jgi:hypothetical protein
MVAGDGHDPRLVLHLHHHHGMLLAVHLPDVPHHGGKCLGIGLHVLFR